MGSARLGVSIDQTITDTLSTFLPPAVNLLGRYDGNRRNLPDNVYRNCLNVLILVTASSFHSLLGDVKPKESSASK
jgi:hypothetical protein